MRLKIYKQTSFLLSLYLLLTSFLFTSCNILNPTSKQDEFKENKEKWASLNAVHYQFEYRQSCFCPAEINQWVRVQVSADTIAFVEYVDSTHNQQFPAPQAPYNYWITIETLFDRAEDIIENADEYTITYDATYGFPTEVSADYYKEAIDDEVTYEAANFRQFKTK